MRYLQMESELRASGWLYCGAGMWRWSKSKFPHASYSLLDAYGMKGRAS